MANAEQERFQIQKDLDAEYQKHWRVTYWLARTWPLLFRFFARLFSSEVSSEKSSEQFRKELLSLEDFKKRINDAINKKTDVGTVLDILWQANRQLVKDLVGDDNIFQKLQTRAWFSLAQDLKKLEALLPDVLKDKNVVVTLIQRSSSNNEIWSLLEKEKDFRNKEILMLLLKAGTTLYDLEEILKSLDQISSDLIKDQDVLKFLASSDYGVIFKMSMALQSLKKNPELIVNLRQAGLGVIRAFCDSFFWVRKEVCFSQQNFNNCVKYSDLLRKAIAISRDTAPAFFSYGGWGGLEFYGRIIKVCESAYNQNQTQFTEEQEQEISDITMQKQSPASTSSTTPSGSPLSVVTSSLATSAPTASSSSASVVNAEGAGVVPSEETRPSSSI